MIEIDASALDRAEEMLKGIPGAAKKAVNSAAKRTVRGAKKDAVQKVKERYTIKPTLPGQCPLTGAAGPLVLVPRAALMIWHILSTTRGRSHRGGQPRGNICIARL